MIDIIKVVLGLAALYCGGAWLWLAVSFWRVRKQAALASGDIRRDVATHTFRLGLCFILALGFLGLIV